MESISREEQDRLLRVVSAGEDGWAAGKARVACAARVTPVLQSNRKPQSLFRRKERENREWWRADKQGCGRPLKIEGGSGDARGYRSKC